jgi:uncharacterized protein (TIGR02466 family)
VHPLFPTTVCEFNYPNSSEFKKKLSKTIFKYLNEDGFSHEMTGHVTIHQEIEYQELYRFLQYCVEQYLKVLNVDSEKFNIFFVKSWFNILSGSTAPKHSHADAHLSLTYYANVPKNFEQAIRFYKEDYNTEPFYGCNRWNNVNNNWNMLNSSTWQFFPKEGDVFVFPSKLYHDTVNEGNIFSGDDKINNDKDFENSRICIASDILLVYKNKQALPLGIQPVENWRTFN